MKKFMNILLSGILFFANNVKATNDSLFNSLMKEVQNDKQALQVNFNVKELKSKSGIPIWLVKNNSPVIVFSASWHLGGLVTEKKPGSKEVFVEMANKGPVGLSYQEYIKQKDTLDLTANYNVARDSLYFTAIILKDYLKQSMDLCANLIHNPRLDQADFEEVVNKKARSLSENDHPKDLVANDLWKFFYKDHPYGKILSPGDFRSLRYEDIVSVHKESHTLDNLKIVVVGDISEDEAVEAVDLLFTGLPKESMISEEKYIEIPRKSEVRVLSYPTPHVSGVFIHNAYNNKKDTKKLLMEKLLINALGGAGVLGSRLSRNIREKNGWVYSINCYIKRNHYSNLVVGLFSCSPENTNKVIKAIGAEYKKMCEKGLTQEELDDMKAYFYGNVASSIISNGDIADLFMGIMLEDETPEYFNNIYKIADSITLEEINQAAKELVRYNELIFSVLGNIADAKLNSEEPNKLIF